MNREHSSRRLGRDLLFRARLYLSEQSYLGPINGWSDDGDRLAFKILCEVGRYWDSLVSVEMAE